MLRKMPPKHRRHSREGAESMVASLVATRSEPLCAKDVASNNFPFWNCLGKRCAALPFLYVAGHTALRAPCTAFAQAAPKREVITRHILSQMDFEPSRRMTAASHQ
jgi:hypothetical protein